MHEAISAGLVLTDVFVGPDTFDDHELLKRCEDSGALILEVGDNVLRSVAATATPQGIVGVARMPAFDLTGLPDRDDLVLVLAEVRDPGNAGTLVRSAAAAGAACVVFTRGSTDPYGAKTVRSSAGTIFKLPVARAIETEAALSALKERGYRCLGGRADASDAIYDLDLTGKVALVVGNEAWGFDQPDLAIDEWVSIPIHQKVESLNVATAGAIMLFEAVRQRRLSSPRHG